MRLRAVMGAASALALTTCAGPTDICFIAPPTGTHQSALHQVVGNATCGTGGTSVTPVPVPEAHFVATIRFVVNRAKPNATYYVQRAAEVGASTAATNADRTCQRADELPPWSGMSPIFVSFPIPWQPGPLITLQTDAEGNGDKEFEFQSPSIPRGTEFDVEMRLVDDLTSPTSELRSGCMTVEVR